jgi:hypothetical protein
MQVGASVRGEHSQKVCIAIVPLSPLCSSDRYYKVATEVQWNLQYKPIVGALLLNSFVSSLTTCYWPFGCHLQIVLSNEYSSKD